MTTLTDLYDQLQAADYDVEKLAAEEAVSELYEESQGVDEDIIKMAAEYDEAGRALARSYFGEMLKSAMPEEDKEEEDEEEDDEKKKKEEDLKKKGLPPALAAAISEKKAAYKQRMLEDPEFAQAMFERFSQ